MMIYLFCISNPESYVIKTKKFSSNGLKNINIVHQVSINNFLYNYYKQILKYFKVLVIPGEKTTCPLFNVLTRDDVYLRSFISIGRLKANATNLLISINKSDKKYYLLNDNRYSMHISYRRILEKLIFAYYKY